MPRILWWVHKGRRICFIQQCIFIQQRLPVHRVRACYALLQLQIMISRISLRVSYTHIYYLCPPSHVYSLRRIYSYLPLDLCVSEKIKLIGGANWRTHYLYSYVLISLHPWRSLLHHLLILLLVVSLFTFNSLWSRWVLHFRLPQPSQPALTPSNCWARAHTATGLL